MTVSAFDQSCRVTKVRYRVLVWLTAAAALAYLCRNAIGVAESTIRNDLGLTLKQSGWFMGAFFWTYAVFQVPCGWFSERVGSRIALSIFTLSWSTAMLVIGVMPGFWLLIVAQLTMGIAQAGLVPALCNSVGHWMPVSQRSLGWGIVGSGMQIGAVAASALAGLLTMEIGWRLVFIAFALPGFVWTLGFFVRFRDDPSQVLQPDSGELNLILAGRSAEHSPTPKQHREPLQLLAIAGSPNMWWLCAQQMCRAGGYMFFASWFPTFLQETRGVSIEQSGFLQGVVFVGAFLGSILGGVVTDWLWRKTGNLRVSRSGVGGASLVFCSLMILSAWFVEHTEFAVLFLSLVAFAVSFAGPSSFAATIDIAGPRVPQVAGAMNMAGNLAAASCPVLVGTLFEWTENWNLILLLLAAVFLAGAICWLFVDPRKCIE